MDKTHYTISDAAKELHVEPHVLRYWEEELSLPIPRNKMGHRLYGPKEMEQFRQIMLWKDEGLTLKEIEVKCPHKDPDRSIPDHQVIPYPADRTALEAAPAQEDEKMKQFKIILGRIVSDAIRDNSDELTTDIAENVSIQVGKELDFLFREKEEADEKRFRDLDETIRNYQKARQEAAAAEITEIRSKKKKRGIRKKKNSHADKPLY